MPKSKVIGKGKGKGKGGKGKGKSKFKGKVKSWSLISGLNEEDLEEMLEVSRAELKRRRTGDRENTQSEEEDVELGYALKSNSPTLKGGEQQKQKTKNKKRVFC